MSVSCVLDANILLYAASKDPADAAKAAAALELMTREDFGAPWQIRYWDAPVLAATRQLGAPILYSEDLNHGQDYDGVKVIDPFRGLD